MSKHTKKKPLKDYKVVGPGGQSKSKDKPLQDKINNAKRAKEINESFNNPCATLVGKNRASDLIAGRGLSLSIVKKTYSYLSRANEYVTGKYTDEKGKPIKATKEQVK